MISIKQYIKEEKNGLIQSFLAFILIIIIFCLYIYYVGAPMTKARQVYNEGVRLLDNGKTDQAKQKFIHSNSIYKTKETTTQLDSLP